MSDNILSAVLTFSVLLAGSAAIGSEVVGSRQAASTPAETRVVMLPEVTVIGHRTEVLQVVMLPTVTVTGHRSPVTLAFEPRLVEVTHAE